jgi:replicative superfamily II helicase
LCAQFGWTKLHAFQLAGIIAQLKGQDVVIHVATSMGKTAVAARPFVLEKCANRIVIYIIPLLALQDEMVRMFK